MNIDKTTTIQSWLKKNPDTHVLITETIPQYEWCEGESYLLVDTCESYLVEGVWKGVTVQEVIYKGYKSIFQEEEKERTIEYHFHVKKTNQVVTIPVEEIDDIVFVYCFMRRSG